MESAIEIVQSRRLSLPLDATLDEYMIRTMCADQYRRSMLGPPFYLIGLILIYLAGGAGLRMQQLLLGAGVIITISYFLRRQDRPPPESADVNARSTWLDRSWRRVYVSFIIWGCVMAGTAVDQQELTAPIVVAIICSVSIITSCMCTYAPPPKERYVLLGLQITPFAAIWTQFPSLRMATLAIGLYWLSAFVLGKWFHDEYVYRLKLEHAMLRSQAELDRLSRRDALTGLWNRLEYEREFEKHWSLAKRMKTPISILVIDADHFKKINDTHGHLAGDACLKHIASILSDHFRRGSDFIARIGGEEFVAILPGSNVAGAAAIAEELRQALEATPCSFEGVRIGVTVSIGAGSPDWEMDKSTAATFARVDAASYEAKQQGRNRVVVC
ncbi:MAG TPA: GGDEF domain-containing protein [Burkholderiaceae bacterium]